MVRGFLIACMLATLAALGCGCGREAKEAKTEVALLPPGLLSPFHQQTQVGAQKAADEFGWELIVQAPGKESDFNEQIRIVEDMVTRGVKGISLCAIDDQAIGRAIETANRAGVPIFVHNSLTPVKSGKVTEYIGYNQFEGGRKCGLYAAKLLNGKGKVFIVMGIPGFHNTQRTGGFKAGLKGFPGIEIVGEQPADWDREKAVNVASQALERNPDIDLIFGASDELAIGATRALKEKGKKAFTLGIDGNEATLTEIEDGNVTATLGVFPDKMGEIAMRQLKKVLDGESVPEFLETPSVVVDRQNLAAYRSGRLWTEPKTSSAESLAE